MNTKYFKVIPVAVMMLSGIFSAQAQTPGGIDLTGNGYTLDLWVDGDHSTNTSWNNIVPANYLLTKFSTNAPITQNSKFNFHNELYFGNTASSKLRTSTPYSLQAGSSYYIFTVSDATGIGTTDAVLFTFNSSATNTNLRWGASNNANNVISSYWTTTQRPPNTAAGRTFLPANFPQKQGIATMNIANINNGWLDMYLNGTKASYTLGNTAATGAATTNAPLMLGNASPSATGNTYGFKGSMQEFILIRKQGAATLMPDADIAKIQSYLAIKYGITLNNNVVTSSPNTPSPNPSIGVGSNYVNSGGDVVWSQQENAGYNYNIFGIGRDDLSGLYQKQSQSVNNKSFSVYTGNALAPLNSQNTGTIDIDKQFLMIGANSKETLLPVDYVSDNIVDGQVYDNGAQTLQSTTGFNLKSPVYKAQLTGTNAMTVNFMVNINVLEFTHFLVSKNADFTPADTKIYNIAADGSVNDVVIDADYKFIRMLGFSPGPGGVNEGLLLWLRADNAASLTIESSSATTDTRLNSVLNYVDNIPDSENIPAIEEWKDLVRGHNYSWAAGGTADAHRIPVMKYYSPELNYWPAVNFWGNSSNFGAYLANPVGLTPSTNPHRAPHTVIIMTNNNFVSGYRIYALMFGATTGTEVTGPGYGVELSGGNLVGRFRPPYNGTLNLFESGATSILNYSVVQSNNKVLYRFNGKQDLPAGTFAWGTAAGFHLGSQLGKGYNYTRNIVGVISEVIIYTKELTFEERQKVESFLALKYGVTLNPDDSKYTTSTPNGQYHGFNYEFSNGTPIWSGDTLNGKFHDYYNRVAAIIRDDAAHLNNRQSHSTNIGSLLHLGVAGSVLSINGDKTDLGGLENMEAVVFGDDNGSGNIKIPIDPNNPDEACGDFTDRFSRIWYIRKITANDRPIELLVGAQDNSEGSRGSTIGNDAVTAQDYYPKLSFGYDVTLIVAHSRDSLINGNYAAVVPMVYINGEYQCRYTFTEQDTYITFGWKVNNSGCKIEENAVFNDAKIYDWQQWLTTTNRNASTVATGLTISPQLAPPNGNSMNPLNIGLTNAGDSILVTSKVVFPVDVRTNRGYPRMVNTPFQKSLLIQRRLGGMLMRDVIDTVKFSYPVIPDFWISGIDATGNSYEEVEVYGQCDDGANYAPRLSFASNPANASYKIVGRRATVYKRGAMAATNLNGRVKVEFLSGVKNVIIKYRIKNANTTANRQIWVSPFNVRSVPPPVYINEHGLGFTKRVEKRSYSICDDILYSFEILNTNCEEKTVQFSDTLPENMKWKGVDYVGLDGDAAVNNPAFDCKILPGPPGRGEILTVELNVAGSSVLAMHATACMETSAIVGKEYANQAAIAYIIKKDNKDEDYTLASSDKDLDENFAPTIFTLEDGQPAERVEVIEDYSRKTYSENNEILVTYTFNNPNIDLEKIFLNINFNNEFLYVPGSFKVFGASGVQILSDTVPASPTFDSGMLYIGQSKGTPEVGFTMPTGEMTIQFKLKAPKVAVDETQWIDPDDPSKGEILTGNKVDLVISYEVNSEMDDTCLLRAVENLNGVKEIPYTKGRDGIISNKHVTTKIK